ncbi:MAG: hypothetical protein AAGG02_18105 [Cyanobacteria bacterium P01_H01_bin.15]
MNLSKFAQQIASRAESYKLFAYFLGALTAFFYAVQHAFTNPLYTELLRDKDGIQKVHPIMDAVLFAEVITLLFTLIFLMEKEVSQGVRQLSVNPDRWPAILEYSIFGILSLISYIVAQSGLKTTQVAILAAISPFTYPLVALMRSKVFASRAPSFPKFYWVFWFLLIFPALFFLFFGDHELGKLSWNPTSVLAALFTPLFFYWAASCFRESFEKFEIFPATVLSGIVAGVVTATIIIVVFFVGDYRSEVWRSVIAFSDATSNKAYYLLLAAIGTFCIAFPAKILFQSSLFASSETESTISLLFFLTPLFSTVLSHLVFLLFGFSGYDVSIHEIIASIITIPIVISLNYLNKKE